jgi:hypothetical protein
MTNQQINDRVTFYRRALMAGRITAKEFEGFLEALAKIGAHELEELGGRGPAR